MDKNCYRAIFLGDYLLLIEIQQNCFEKALIFRKNVEESVRNNFHCTYFRYIPPQARKYQKNDPIEEENC